MVARYNGIVAKTYEVNSFRPAVVIVWMLRLKMEYYQNCSALDSVTLFTVSSMLI